MRMSTNHTHFRLTSSTVNKQDAYKTDCRNYKLSNKHVSGQSRSLHLLSVQCNAMHMHWTEYTRNLSWCSWDAPQHQFNFLRRLSWSISSTFQRKFTL